MRAFFHSRNGIGSLAGFILLAVSLGTLLSPSPSSRAGGPIIVGGTFGVPGEPFKWDTAAEIPFHVDGGTLGSLDNAGFVAKTIALYQVWEDVSTATIGFNHGNPGVGLQAAGVADGDVNTVAEFTTVNCPSAAFAFNPVISDTDGTLFTALGFSSGVIGFAGPCFLSGANVILNGRAALNGKWIDGNAANGELTPSGFDGSFIHEFGHESGLAHPQGNVNCLSGGCAAFSDDAFGLPTMFPFALGLLEAAGVDQSATLSTDDIAIISELYKAANFSATFGRITGTIFFSDGITQAQGVNVIARMVDNPGTPGINESRRILSTSVSGFRMSGNFGQPVSGTNGAGSSFGSRDTSLMGFFDIVVPPGQYTVEVETIFSGFIGGSGVPPLDPPIPNPGLNEFFDSAESNSDNPATSTPVTVVAGAPAANTNIILNGTAPALDAFDTAARNETRATATPITNGTTSATVSPHNAADVDFYSFNTVAAQVVTIDINARGLPAPRSPLAAVIQIQDTSGVMPTACGTTVAGPFNIACRSFVTPSASSTSDPILFFSPPTSGTFFVQVLDFRGLARPDFRYDLVLSGAAAAGVSINPASLNFPNTIVGATSAVMSSTYTNNSGASVTISTAVLEGTDPTHFSVAAGTTCINNAVIANGASCVGNFTFNPLFTGPRNARYRIADNATGSPRDIIFMGLGVAAGVVSLAPATFDFGNQIVGVPSSVQNFTLSNNSGSPLSSIVVSYTGANGNDFVRAAGAPGGTCAGTLSNGNSCTIGTLVTAGASGTRSGTLNVAYTGAAGSPLQSSLTANGVAVGGNVTATPTSVNFGTVVFFTSSPAVSVQITNGTANAVNIAGISITGTNREKFFLNTQTGSSGCPFGPSTLNSGSSCFVDVSFAALETGTFNGALTVNHNAAGSPLNVPLTGISSSANIPGPINDNINNAILIDNIPFLDDRFVNTATINTGGLTDPAIPAACTAPFTPPSANNSIWYRADVDSNGRATAHTLFSTYDTILSVWTGTPGSFGATPIACNDDFAGGSGSLVEFDVTAGTTIFIMVSSFSGAVVGDEATLLVDFAETAPANNNFAAATQVVLNSPYINTVNSIRATEESTANDPNATAGCADGAAASGRSNSVWWKFTPGSNGTITANTTGSTYDTILAVFSGAPGALVPVTCNDEDPASFLVSAVSFAATGGTTFFFRVSAFLGDGGYTNFFMDGPAAGGGAPAVTLNPTSVPFGNQLVGTQSAVTDITLTNSGTANLNVATIALAGAFLNDFAIVAPTTGPACAPLGGPFVLAAGANCKFGTRFNPTSPGLKGLAARVTSNAAGSPHDVALTGTGVQPALTPNPTSIPFGDVGVGATSTVTNIQIQNTGTAVLNIVNIVKNGADAAQFNLVAPTAGAPACIFGVNVINPGNSCFFGVSASPTSTGAKVANVALTSDGVVSPVNIPLSANGVQANIAFNPTSLAFGNVRVDALLPPTLFSTLTNNGAAPLNITAIALTGADASQFLLAPILGSCAVGTPVPPAGTCFINAGFDPTSVGPKAASASIASNGTPNPALLPLTGTGTAPAVTFNPTTAPFGNQKVATTSAVTHVALTNSGTATLNYASIIKAGADPTQFVLTAAANGPTPACVLGGSILNPATSCNFDVAFAPTSAGAKSASAQVSSDAPGSPHSVPLTGAGVLASPPTFAPTNVAFGNVKVGTTSAKQDVTITNPGAVPIEIVSLSLTGVDPARFTLGAPTSGAACPLGASSLPAAGSCKVGITYSPTTAVANSANLSVADDAPGSPHTVPLTGAGVNPSPPTFSPSPVAIGNVKVGTTSAVTNVAVTNPGAVALAITGITKSGANAALFTLSSVANGATPACPLGASTLNAGASCNVGVTASPTGVGPINASMAVADDAPASPHSVALSATGAVPTAALTNSPVNVGTQLVGTTSAAAGTPATLTNTGTVPLAITSIVKGGANAADFTLTTGGTACATGASVLAPAASCTINSTVTPSATGARVATATITDDSGGVAGATQVVTFNATGVDVALSANPTSQTVVAGQSAAFTITATPSGGTVAGPVTYSCPGSLPQGVTCAFVPASISNFGTPTNSTLTINTTARALIVPPPSPPTRIMRLLPFTVALFGLLLIALTLAMKPASRRRLEFGLAVGLLFVVMGVAVGCSAAVDNTGTPPGTTNITVTGAVSGANKTVPITLTVQ